MSLDVQYSNKSKPFEAKVTKKYDHYVWMLAFVVASISIAFLALTVTYFFSRQLSKSTVPLDIPAVFYIDTFILVLGSVALHLCSKAFANSKAMQYKVWMYVALLSGFTFLFGQVAGWVVLSKTGFGLVESNAGAYLHVISGLHALHIIFGLVFLVYFFVQANKQLREDSLSVVYFTDPKPKGRLKLMNYYWHFLGFLWLYLLVFFSVVR